MTAAHKLTAEQRARMRWSRSPAPLRLVPPPRPTRYASDEPQSWHDTAPFLCSMFAALCIAVAVKFAFWAGWL